MKLKEKFENVEIMFEGQTGTLKYDELCEASNKCEEIADVFAIGFAEWCLDNFLSICKGVDDNREILKIYKKTLE